MKTLFDKIWDAHIVKSLPDGPDVLYIDKHFIHEVTSPQAFSGLEARGISVLRPTQVVATADHNVPTLDQHLPIVDALSAKQVSTLVDNCEKFGIDLWGLGHEKQGIVHIIGPELGITQPGMTIVCGDSHTATHGAFGAIAFGIGTSEVEMVLATQCLMQNKPKPMRINVDGKLQPGVTAKDLILYIIAQVSTSGGTGHFVEYAGSAIRGLSMEGRMTVCNMSIELGARGGMIAPDEVTFDYLKDKPYAPQGEAFDEAVAQWKTLATEPDAVFAKEFTFQAEDIEPMVTFGTAPDMGIGISAKTPGMNTDTGRTASLTKAFNYMNLKPEQSLEGLPINYVFVGSCTNGRIEDLRAFAAVVNGRQKASNVKAYIVPGSQAVLRQAEAEGIVEVLAKAGFEMRQPGCSACLAMNEDKIPAGEYCVSTSNRNFEGRQGQGARTILASPAMAAAAAVTGRITDVRSLQNHLAHA